MLLLKELARSDFGVEGNKGYLLQDWLINLTRHRPNLNRAPIIDRIVCSRIGASFGRECVNPCAAEGVTAAGIEVDGEGAVVPDVGLSRCAGGGVNVGYRSIP